jgi:hypothetical protein
VFLEWLVFLEEIYFLEGVLGWLVIAICEKVQSEEGVVVDLKDGVGPKGRFMIKEGWA